MRVAWHRFGVVVGKGKTGFFFSEPDMPRGAWSVSRR